ncbi:benzyl alcohol O-benzoyltransferase [Oryza sativa Japonica Group]|uniref:Os05g0315700 protein n=3 Tax=Oryza TaxID=4527 RepID=Q5WMS2_ORYSJ|nr:methanol O-anthraniloyltransferase [Oryza sativa Japonica Group]AAV32163.1 hypothetical protein [Oryza sativa Japonica Group]KAB8098872.1 hypothetical protein EE612_028597 [Oryza sativa]KAF2930155.1 hypothetical protein DAI22_05g111400 [Oryza sativa Japonica Group]BAS93320.1 Os05g0315700 [Oryza sativa Japonica Group]
MAGAPTSLGFSVRRRERELVAPARPTPYEFKMLSDIDDQDILRFNRSGISFYRHNPNQDGVDPVTVIRAALSEALVHFYPLAGRLRELRPTRKLVVECTGEGVVFVEADASFRMDDLGDGTSTSSPLLAPPVPCYDMLLCEAESPTADVVDRPLLFVQMTRLACGGFVFGMHICHCMADGSGMVQFLTAVTEFARGVPGAPTVPPVWEREALTTRSWPPTVTRDHVEYAPLPVDDDDDDVLLSLSPSTNAYAHHVFFFGDREIAALRSQVVAACSRFDLVGAFMWRCRTAALRHGRGDVVRLNMFVNARVRNRPVPRGYYGNAIVFASASAPAGELCGRPLGHALRLLVEAKARAWEDGYVQSVASFNAARRRPAFPKGARTYFISDMTRAGMTDIDFGWGKPVYGGPATTMLATFHLQGRNEAGEAGIVVPISLPSPVMERLIQEVDKGLNAGAAAVLDDAKARVVPDEGYVLAKL